MVSLDSIKELVMHSRKKYDDEVLEFLLSIPTSKIITDMKHDLVRLATDENVTFQNDAVIESKREIHVENLFKTSPWARYELTSILNKIKESIKNEFPGAQVNVCIRDYGLPWIQIHIRMDLLVSAKN
jgi:hypothetical protein